MSWNFQHKPPIGWPIDPDHPLSDFVAFWPMWEDSGNTVQDLSGNNNHSPAFGNSVTWAAGPFGSALDFSNAGAGVPINNSSLLKPGTGDMTWVIWLDMDDDTGQDDFLSDRQPGAAGTIEGFVIGASGVSDAGHITVFLEESGGDYKSYEKEGAYTVSEGWFQLAVTWNNASDELLIYKNSVDVTSEYLKETDNNLTGKSIANSENFIIGARPSGSREINGRISHVPIYPRTLSPSEIALLFSNPFCMFKDPAELALLAGALGVPAAGVMAAHYYKRLLAGAA